eukprot:765564-Rhodomonas_salina.1
MGLQQGRSLGSAAALSALCAPAIRAHSAGAHHHDCCPSPRPNTNHDQTSLLLAALARAAIPLLLSEKSSSEGVTAASSPQSLCPKEGSYCADSSECVNRGRRSGGVGAGRVMEGGSATLSTTTAITLLGKLDTSVWSYLFVLRYQVCRNHVGSRILTIVWYHPTTCKTQSLVPGYRGQEPVLRERL